MGEAKRRKLLEPNYGKLIYFVFINPAKKLDESEYRILKELILSPEEAARMPQVQKVFNFTGASLDDLANAFKRTCESVGNTDYKIRVYECLRIEKLA